VVACLQTCRELGLPITFRAAGTSLSGQACTDSVLLMLADTGWNEYIISADGSEITLQPGIRGAQANRYLAPYGKKIGPDPASIDSAKIGGIIANNACGMAGGVAHNSQYTLKDIRLIFADGTILDTADKQSRKAFLLSHSKLADRLLQLSGKLKQNKMLADRIRNKYRIKNTTGYSVNALIEHDDPIEIIKHLMVGSEGTLAFISSVTLRTIDEARTKATSLMLFPDMGAACEAVLLLRDCKVHAAELIDRAALRTVENKKGVPSSIKQMGDQVTALLVETTAADRKSLEDNILEIREKLKAVKLANDSPFSMDSTEATALWNVRKGIFPCACSEREPGTAVIIEDIAVPVVKLHACIVDLQGLFARYGYRNCVIWGHVFDGNVHFVLTPDFSSKEEVEKYKAFMFDLADVVIDKYDGSLKAEHGTGRNMAPFVAKEWGPEIYAVMREIKTLFDPHNVLNPGVVISDDPDIFIKHFKPMPAAHDIVDTCIECGFCERSCMSDGFTLSARQRIVIWREMERLKRSGENPSRLKTMRHMYAYHGVNTCAADGLCAVTCPLDIDTGSLIREIREQEHGPVTHLLADGAGRNMRTTTRLLRFSSRRHEQAPPGTGNSRHGQTCRGLPADLRKPAPPLEPSPAQKRRTYSPRKHTPSCTRQSRIFPLLRQQNHGACQRPGTAGFTQPGNSKPALESGVLGHLPGKPGQSLLRHGIQQQRIQRDGTEKGKGT
jgi:D-lactate dehydrogenase